MIYFVCRVESRSVTPPPSTRLCHVSLPLWPHMLWHDRKENTEGWGKKTLWQGGADSTEWWWVTRGEQWPQVVTGSLKYLPLIGGISRPPWPCQFTVMDRSLSSPLTLSVCLWRRVCVHPPAAASFGLSDVLQWFFYGRFYLSIPIESSEILALSLWSTSKLIC